jgi:diaminopimelate decarboxylase
MLGFRRDAQGAALLSGTPLREILAQAGTSTPAYVYDLDALSLAGRWLESSFGGARHLSAYALKANSAGSILKRLIAEGLGVDVVSGAELELALSAGAAPSRVVMSGVAKADWELDLAIARGIKAIHAESVEELDRIAARARAASQTARVALRVNPGVEIDSHAHVATGHDAAKFGVHRDDLGLAFARIDASQMLEGVGLSAHVGSMLATPEPYLASARRLCEQARARLASGGRLEYIDFGGGFGIDYGAGATSLPGAFVERALGLLAEVGLAELELVIEPGRSMVGPYGVLVASVIQTKVSGTHRWLMVDAGMNDLIRPALYGAKHRIEPVDCEPGTTAYRVVGPVCESTDDFGEHAMSEPAPNLVVMRDAGAYGFVMASEYNGRPLPAEIFVSGGRVVSVSPTPGREAWIRRRLEA